MRKSALLILILMLFNSHFFAKQKSPEEIVKQYNKAYLNNNWREVAEFTEPNELSEFRKNLKNNYYKIVASEAGLKNVDSLYKLSDRALYAFFLQYVYSEIPSLKDVTEKLIIGTLYKNKEYAYVVYKSDSKDVNVIELKNSNNGWKINFVDPYIEIIFVNFNKKR
jgi:hypothetical protein